VDEGAQLAVALAARRDAPTAAVCASDPLALGAWRSRALAVIGFDDGQVAQAIGLSSVRQPLARAAAECVDALAALLGDRTAAEQVPGHVLLKPELVVRESSNPR
jgi:DNA-binding LacI/PurR family transcriptional regulator